MNPYKATLIAAYRWTLPRQHILTGLLVALLCLLPPYIAYAQKPVVNAILFYSPSCGHCHKVITEDLPPLIEKFGDQLNIIGIDVSTEGGQELYRAAVERYQIPQERLGVPCLVVGEIVMVGSLEIPDQFPGIIDQGLAAGGIALPEIPGLQEALVSADQDTQNSQQAGESEHGIKDSSSQETEGNQQAVDASVVEEMPVAITESNSATASDNMSVQAKLARDPVGNALALIVLAGMVGSLVAIGIGYPKTRSVDESKPANWLIPVFAIAGLLVAAYLSYVEVTHSQAVCGPVGDCNTVQQSPYARLFGVLPVGVLGMLGYLTILIAVIVERLAANPWKLYARIAIWLMALFGVLFSIYLTILEPFVIGATCMWCITSAVIMTLILWLANSPARSAWQELRSG